ncbi:hypothetical protein D3C81_962590 [compost metagenome]
MGDWEEQLGVLTGELLLVQEEADVDGITLIADRVYEFESGAEYSLEEFIAVTKEEN